MSATKPVPEGASVLMPMLVCRNAGAELEFCKTAFGADERVNRPGPDGSVAHALVTIGGAMVMIEAEWPTLDSRAPTADGSSPVVIYVYVESADAVLERAVAAGATILVPIQNQFWGDRTARIMDPAGHVWIVSSRIEETSEDQRRERWSNIVSTKD